MERLSPPKLIPHCHRVRLRMACPSLDAIVHRAFSSMPLPEAQSMTPARAEDLSHTGRVNRCECRGGWR
jgi:hypothetical protein